MVDEITVSGADKLVDLGQRLKAAGGDKGKDSILATMRREINADTKTLRQNTQRRIRATLPQRGGLNVWAGGLPATSVKIERDRASVKVVLSKRGHDLVAMNRRGVVRHPLWGNRRKWFSTSIPADFYEAAVAPEAEALIKTVSEAIGRAVDRSMMKEV